jgi:hypothetical protein
VDTPVDLAARSAAKQITLRSSKEYGFRYAHTVRVASPQGSTFDGMHGMVARVVGGTVFVRFGFGTLPFGAGELEVLS